MTPIFATPTPTDFGIPQSDGSAHIDPNWLVRGNFSSPDIFQQTDGTGAVFGTGVALTLTPQVQKTVWAGPTSGTNAAPTFRSLSAADLPPHNSLSGLQGGTTAEYYHLTSAQATSATRYASGSQDGLLSATNFTIFNAKEPAIAAGITSQYWRGDKSWQILNAVAVGATTVGGNLFGLTNPSAITFLRLNADNTASALDAATFRTAIGAGTGSGTVTNVTGSAPVVSSGGATPVISMAKSTGSVDGYLAATDFTTFNSKQASGNYITSLTGDVTASGPGSVAGTIAASAVSLAKMADLAANSIIGNNTGSPATPLALTAAQAKTILSLNNVENTALSTWVGSANLTTLGTIATGTWNATTIADGKIASALTGKTYNALSLTAASVGFTVAGGTTSKTLSILGDTSIDQDLLKTSVPIFAGISNGTDRLTFTAMDFSFSPTANQAFRILKDSGAPSMSWRNVAQTNSFCEIGYDFTDNELFLFTQFSSCGISMWTSGTKRLTLTSTGEIICLSSFQTASPSGGTAKPWKLGGYAAGIAVQTGKVRVEIDGVAIDLLTA